MDVTLDPQPSHLRVVVKGDLDLNMAFSGFDFLLMLCEKDGHERILVDLLEIGFEASATIDVLYSTEIADRYNAYIKSGGHPVRIAYLGPSGYFKSWQPGLDIHKEQNVPVNTFTDAEEAAAWLGID